jgi:hypothetical protein
VGLGLAFLAVASRAALVAARAERHRLRIIRSIQHGLPWLYADETLPAPSHLLRQLKAHSKDNPAYLGAFSRGAALPKSSRPACGARQEAISVLYDVVGSRQGVAPRNRPPLLPARLEVVKSKANELLGTVELAECYSYLGQEVAGGMLAILSPGGREKPPKAIGLGPVFEGEGRLLSDRLLKDLGLTRGKAAMEAGCQELKEQVTSLAKRV